MRVLRAAFLVAGLAAVPSVAAAQTSTTSSVPTTTTTTSGVTRIEDLVCTEPANNVATCVDPQGRIVTRIDDVRQTTTTVATHVEPHGDVVARDAAPAPPSVGRPLSLTG